ncbi:MAG: fumarylacetoacetate hydrolase family protein [Rhodospirillales bacterium]|jgi:fumarylacetoacetate (FAA) hydrolase family protein|tara:strand:- start:1065 stop:2255 length:1191 start_codon:yes stop_codon:yes gene_type:complete
MSIRERMTPSNCLPEDGYAGTLITRVELPGANGGPTVAMIREDGVYDIMSVATTVTALMELDNPAASVKSATLGPKLGDLADLLVNAVANGRDTSKPYLLAPCDLQALKAAGVTFAASMLERVIEERAKGDPQRAVEIRKEINQSIGVDLSEIVPGSDGAQRLKDELIERDLWSQYLEVAIGPDAEVFTKSQPLSGVGPGADVGLHPRSTWNNPEPEVAVIVNSNGDIKGATLGNDVNLRDFEGRSALLLSKAKDNNASCGVGPFIRLFDDTYSLDDLRKCDLSMEVTGEDGYVLQGASSMSQISRDPADIVEQTIGRVHQYPDGFVLMLGTMFAPTEDRDTPGEGFTHKIGDIVSISTPSLGRLINRVDTSDKCEPWTFGIKAFMENLATRGYLS